MLTSMNMNYTLDSEQDGETGSGGGPGPNGGGGGPRVRVPRVHVWPTLRMVICLVLNVGATVAVGCIWLNFGACTDGLIVVSAIFFGTFAVREEARSHSQSQPMQHHSNCNSIESLSMSSNVIWLL